jgi:hypothetical protein
MIRSNYQIAFKVEVLHTYFENNICSCLQFNWGAISSTLAKRFDLTLKKNLNGFALYVNVKGTLPDFLKRVTQVTNQTFFDFDIYTNTPGFVTFTDLPVSWSGQLMYDSQYELNNLEGNVIELCPNLSNNQNTKSIGKLTVHFDDILKGIPTEDYTRFSINYKARATQWQYYIINKNALPLNNPAISGKADISFSGPESVNMENGQQALLFSSGDVLIPLSANPAYRFDLVSNPASKNNGNDKKTGSPQIIFKGLPIPDPKRVRGAIINNVNQVTSPMYVYL